MASSLFARLAVALAMIVLVGTSLPARALDAATGADVMAALADGDTGRASELLVGALVLARRGEEREDVLAMLAEVMEQAGKPEEAGMTWLELADSLASRLGPNAPERASALEKAGEAFWRANRPDAAVQAQLGAVRIDARRGIAPSESPLRARLVARVSVLPDAALRARLLDAIETPPARPASSGEPRGGSGPSVVAGGSAPGGPDMASTEAPFTTVRIYYATDRARADNPARPDDVYGGARGNALEYGTADVTIPAIHRPGALEAPAIWSFEVADPERHVILAGVKPATRETVYRQMNTHLRLTGSDEAFVFVHGFNVTFADAAKRTAQLAYDMNFDGLPILFSWPSAGNLFSYLPDSAVVQLSGRRLSAFLDEVVRDTGARRIHLVAHSMGNRALVEALELFALRHAGEPPAFDQALFTAPDIDAGLFAMMAETIRPAVNRMTLYTSQNDWALRASRKLHGDAPRAGEGGPGTPIPSWVDSIDMSTLGEDMLAHSYFANDASALSDILTLFWRDTPPARRCGMEEGAPAQTAAHWRYAPELCDGSAMLSALAQMRAANIGSIPAAMALIEEKFAPPDIEPERKRKLETAVATLLR